MYAIAALSGSLLLVLCAALLAIFSPREIPTSPAILPETRPPAAPAAPERAIRQPPLIAQEPAASVKLIAFKSMLQNKDKDPAGISEFIDSAGLQQKYPLGFALFYSDGRKILFYGKPSSSGISFDASRLKVTRIGDVYCLNILPIIVGGQLLDNYRDNCARGNVNLAVINDVAIYAEVLAGLNQKSAWVLGMKPQRQ
jgi:hypothetical protein